MYWKADFLPLLLLPSALEIISCMYVYLIISARALFYYHAQGGVGCSALRRTGFPAVFSPLGVDVESPVLYSNENFHDLL